MDPLTHASNPSLLVELFRQQAALLSTQGVLESKEKDLQLTTERVEVLTSQLQALQKKYNRLKSKQHDIGTSGLTGVGQILEKMAALKTGFVSMVSAESESDVGEIEESTKSDQPVPDETTSSKPVPRKTESDYPVPEKFESDPTVPEKTDRDPPVSGKTESSKSSAEKSRTEGGPPVTGPSVTGKTGKKVEEEGPSSLTDDSKKTTSLKGDAGSREAHSHVHSWEIFVQIKNGRTISLSATPEDTVGKLKDKIQDKANLPKHKVCILYEGKSLEDSHTLAHYNIREGSTLSLTGSFQVYVQLTPGWKTVQLDVQLSDTIADIKTRIRTKEVEAKGYEKLMLGDRTELDDECYVGFYDIGEGNTLTFHK
jgi:hypothetical protein